jgi:hypothetical protein
MQKYLAAVAGKTSAATAAYFSKLTQRASGNISP